VAFIAAVSVDCSSVGISKPAWCNPLHWPDGQTLAAALPLLHVPTLLLLYWCMDILAHVQQQHNCTQNTVLHGKGDFM